MRRFFNKYFRCSFKNMDTSEIVNLDLMAETDEECIIKAKKRYRNYVTRFVVDDESGCLVECFVPDFKRIELKYICFGDLASDDSILENRYPYEIENDKTCKHRDRIVTVNPMITDPGHFKKLLAERILNTARKRVTLDCCIHVPDINCCYNFEARDLEQLPAVLDFTLSNMPDYFYIEEYVYANLSLYIRVEKLHYVTLEDLKRLEIDW